MQSKEQYIFGSKASIFQSLLEKDESLRIWEEQTDDQ